MQQTKIIRPFGMRDKVGYMFGDFANDFTFILSSTFLLKFYTDVVGLDAAIVGTVMMIARFVDAITDTAMGRIVDRCHGTKAGKFKPWLLRMCGPVAIASFLMYQSWLGSVASTAVKTAYLTITYLLWGSVFYTSVNIPYGSMASVLSEDPAQRESLSVWRSVGGMLATLFVSVIAPMIVYDKVGDVDVMNGSKFMAVSGAFSVCAVICYLLCYSLCTERVRPDDTAGEIPLASVGKMLKNAFSNRALLSIIVASICMLVAQLTTQQMASYVYPLYYRNGTMQALSMVMVGVGMLIALVAIRPLTGRFGKAEVGGVSTFVAAMACFLAAILRPENVWCFVALQVVSWCGYGVFNMIVWAMVTDVIDHSEIRNGVREDGQVYALYSFARKLGQAVAAGLSGWLLTGIGYAEGVELTDGILNGIFNISTIIPAAAYLTLAIVLWLWYPLHRRKVEENVTILKKKRGN